MVVEEAGDGSVVEKVGDGSVVEAGDEATVVVSVDMGVQKKHPYILKIK